MKLFYRKWANNGQWLFWAGVRNDFDFFRVGLDWDGPKHAKLRVVVIGLTLQAKIRCPVWHDLI